MKFLFFKNRVKVLCESGADINIKNNDGMNAKELAQEIGASMILLYLKSKKL